MVLPVCNGFIGVLIGTLLGLDPGSVTAMGILAGSASYIAVPAVIGFLLMPVAGAPPLTMGAVNLPAFAIVIGSTLVTTPWGVALAHQMNPKPLKRAFAVFLTLVALNMLRKVVLG